MSLVRRLSCLVAVTVLAAAAGAAAQTADNVAVVINSASAASARIGEHYVRQRAIPAANVIRIRTTEDETVDRAVFASTIEQPIAAAITRERLQDRILYIVLTKGVPLRINGTGGAQGTVASVDSELTLLYRRLTGGQVRVPGRIDNPYYLGASEVQGPRPFSHRDYDIYLVTRLDAFTVDQALGLVDKAKAASPSDARIVLDQRAALVDRTGDTWLEVAAKRLTDLGHGKDVVLESTPKGARDLRPVVGYYSWGSTDPRNRVRTLNMGFVPGAIAATFVSSDGRTFKEPPADWVPANDPDTRSYAGSAQSLIGDLIKEGVTGAAGHVAEPYLQNTIRPDILFPAYVSGANLAEAFYQAMPALSWQTVVIGDPLCAPFPRKALPAADVEVAIDPDTQYPAFFAKRRVAAAMISAPGVAEGAVKLSVRAEAQMGRADLRGARASLEEATAQAPTAAGLHLQLALLLDQLGERKGAAERYRRVLQIQPNNAIALNNLAYSLATFENNPTEGLVLARRAAAVAPQDGNVLDTLAWTHHLAGDDRSAAQRIAQAIRLAPRSPEVRLHAAVINANLGARAVAENELKEALRLNPSLEQSELVRQVRAQLQKLGTPP